MWNTLPGLLYYESIHFGFETQAKGYVLEANYIGNLGRQLVGLENINTFEGRVACSTATQKKACAAAGLTTAQSSTARPTALFSNDNFRTNGFSSNYSGGQVSVRKGYSNGFQLSGNYTYSKAMDEISDVFTQRTGSTGITTPYNPSKPCGATKALLLEGLLLHTRGKGYTSVSRAHPIQTTRSSARSP